MSTSRIKPFSLTNSVLIGLLFVAVVTVTAPTWAQPTSGEPGSPAATTTIDGRQLPAPDPKFGGVIQDNALQSKAWWAPRVVPPKGAQHFAHHD